MANNSEFYRGKRKKTAPALIATIIILAVIAFAVMLFYGLQKYIVVTNSGLHLEIPFLQDDSAKPVQSDDGEVVQQSFEPVNAQLEIGQADYSNIKAVAGENLDAVKLVYVPASSVTASGVESYLSKSPDATGVLLDVKTVTGMLVWDSQADIAKGYGTAGTVDLKSIVSSLKEQDKYVAVRMCCFVDNTLASRYTQLALKTTAGQAYSDSNGAWLDPTNATVKSYILSLCSELSKMGVDEIVLLGIFLKLGRKAHACHRRVKLRHKRDARNALVLDEDVGAAYEQHSPAKRHGRGHRTERRHSAQGIRPRLLLGRKCLCRRHRNKGRRLRQARQSQNAHRSDVLRSIPLHRLLGSDGVISKIITGRVRGRLFFCDV